MNLYFRQEGIGFTLIKLDHTNEYDFKNFV